MNEEIQVNLAEVSALLDEARALLEKIEQGDPECWKFWELSTPKLRCAINDEDYVSAQPTRRGADVFFGDSNDYVSVYSVEEFASFANQIFRYMGGDFAVVHKKARRQ